MQTQSAYNVKFYNGDEMVAEVPVTIAGDEPVYLSATDCPTVAGYSTPYWYTTAAAAQAELDNETGTPLEDGKYNFATEVTEDFELYGAFRPNEYAVGYNTNGGTVDQKLAWQFLTYDSTFILHDADGNYVNENDEVVLTKANVDLIAGVDDDGNLVKEDGTILLKANKIPYADSLTVRDTTSTKADAGSGATAYSFKFDGWNDQADGEGDVSYNPGDVIENTDLDDSVTGNDRSLTLFAQWKPVYKVTYVTAHGDNIKPQTYDRELDGMDEPIPVTVTPPKKPTATGWEFVGWYENLNDNEPFDFTTPITGNKTLTAKWQVKDYKVSYNTGIEGLTIPTATVEYGATMGSSLPTAATELSDGGNLNFVLDGAGHKQYRKDGYEFIAWHTDPALTEESLFTNTTPVTADTPLYADYEPITYTIDFAAGDSSATGSTASKTDVKYTDTVTLPKCGYTLAGRTFTGWKDAEGNVHSPGEEVSGLTLVKGDTVTFTAQWTSSFTLVLNNNQKTGALVQAGAAKAGAVYTEDVTTTQPATVNGTTKVKSFADIKKATPAFEVAGYEFAGWNTVAVPTTENPGTPIRDAGDYVNSSTAQSGSATLYAQWTPKNVTLSYDANADDATGTAPAAATLAFASKTTDTTPVWNLFKVKANTFKRTGYHFTGWNTKKSGTGGTPYAKDATIESYVYPESTKLYAQWAEDTWTVSYSKNDSDEATVISGKTPPSLANQNFGYATAKEITVPEPVWQRVGYENAAKWNTKADGTGTTYNPVDKITNTDLLEDTTLYLVWEPKYYTAEFYSEDGKQKIGEQLVAYNAKPEYDADKPVKQTAALDYPFLGWSTTKNAHTAEAFDFMSTYLTLTGPEVSQVDVAKFYAVFDTTPVARKYDVEFLSTGVVSEDLPVAQEVTYNNSAVKPEANPTAEDYTFDGWFVDEELTTPATFSEKIVEDTAYYANWKPTAEKAAEAAKAAEDAQAAIDALVVSEDGKDVASDKRWVTQELKDALQDAVDAYKAAGENANGTQISAVENALAIAKAAAAGKDTDKAIASETDQTSALAAAKTLQSQVAAGQKSMDEKAAKALDEAIAAAEAKEGKMTNGDVAALKAATAVAEKAAADKAAADKKAADEAAKADADKALAAAEKALADENLPSDAKAELQKAIDAFKASDKGADALKALNAATDKAVQLSTAKAAEKAASKSAQTVTVTDKSVSVKAKKLKKKAVKVKASKVTKGNSAATAITYSKVKANKKNKKFTVAEDGTITVGKKLKKGTYKVTVRANAAATDAYQGAEATFVVTIKVK